MHSISSKLTPKNNIKNKQDKINKNLQQQPNTVAQYPHTPFSP